MLTMISEHGYSHPRRLPPSLRHRPRRRPPLLSLDLPRRRRPAPQRRARRVGRIRRHHLHDPPLVRGLHVPRLGRRRAVRRRVRADLPGQAVPDARDVSEAGLGPGAVEPAVPGGCGAVEWLGRCGPVLAVRVSR